jgi:hypothetical protein
MTRPISPGAYQRKRTTAPLSWTRQNGTTKARDWHVLSAYRRRLSNDENSLRSVPVGLEIAIKADGDFERHTLLSTPLVIEHRKSPQHTTFAIMTNLAYPSN